MSENTKQAKFPNSTVTKSGVKEIKPDELLEQKDKVNIFDVRRPEEFTGELGHIAGAKMATLETDFPKVLEGLPKNETYVFVCRSGVRSARAASWAQSAGLRDSFNMVGGMMYWKQLGFETEK